MNIKTLLVILLAFTCSHSVIAQVGKDSVKVFKYVEQMPTPPYNVNQYISSTLRYPEEAIENGLQGRVMVHFIVDADGSITNVYAEQNGVDTILQMEAIRVVEQMPKWIPGKNHGSEVKVFYMLPLVFHLDDGDKKTKKKKRR